MADILPETADTFRDNSKFVAVAKKAYSVGLVGHLILIFVFAYLDIVELILFNIFFSVPIFSICYLLAIKEYDGIAFSLAFLEILLHQILATYYLGWDFGAHFWLIYPAGVSYINPKWSAFGRIFLIAIVAATYTVLFFNFRIGKYTLQDSVSDSFYIINSLTTLFTLVFLIDYFSRITYSAEQSLKQEQLLTTRMLRSGSIVLGLLFSLERPHPCWKDDLH